MTQQVTDGDFKTKVLEADGLVLVDFGAEWCPPCKALEPVIADIGRELAGSVTVYAMDVDTSPETAAQFGVRGVPTVLLFRNGQPVERLVGLRPKAQLLSAIQKEIR